MGSTVKRQPFIKTWHFFLQASGVTVWRTGFLKGLLRSRLYVTKMFWFMASWLSINRPLKCFSNNNISQQTVCQIELTGLYEAGKLKRACAQNLNWFPWLSDGTTLFEYCWIYFWSHSTFCRTLEIIRLIHALHFKCSYTMLFQHKHPHCFIFSVQ